MDIYVPLKDKAANKSFTSYNINHFGSRLNKIGLLSDKSRISELKSTRLRTHTFLIDIKQLNRELMKEILQTKEENLKLPMLSTSSCFDSCICTCRTRWSGPRRR